MLALHVPHRLKSLSLSLSLSLLLSSNARSSVLPRPHPRQRLERKMELLSLCWGSCPEKKKCAHLGLPPRKRSGKGHRFAVGWERGEGPAGVCARACVCLCVCVRHARPGAGMVAAPVARSCKKMKSSYRRRNRKKKTKRMGEWQASRPPISPHAREAAPLNSFHRPLTFPDCWRFQCLRSRSSPRWQCHR